MNSEIILVSGLCLAAFFVTYFLTYLIRRYALAKSLIDIPNARSSHSIPTPRGGGLSIVIVCLLPLLLMEASMAKAILFNDTYPVSFGNVLQVFGIPFAFLAVAGIGFWDDHQHIPARWRLLVHFCASALLLGVLLSLRYVPISLPFSIPKTIPPPLLILLAALLVGFHFVGLVWLLNLFNFMDGIDGIASVEAITVAVCSAILLFFKDADYQQEASWLLFLASAVAGFLVWNFPSAKIFMGDACSGFLGFCLGFFVIITSALHFGGFEMMAGVPPLNLCTWLILLGVFITDATFTLIKRILNKEVWYEAHASHAYQHYARNLIQNFQQQGFDSHDARTKSHRRVNFHMTLINVFWLFPLAAAATFYLYWAFLMTVIAYLPLIFIAYTLKAGITE